MIFEKINTVLVLAPHPDDAEFGLGGTISKLIENGKEVHVITFSLCEKSTPKGFEIGQIEQEMYESMNKLNIPKSNLIVFDFPVREFPAFRQEILEKIILERNRIQPDLVFIPSSDDIHQDHQTIHNEGVRAFKFNNLLGYEMPWNNFGFTSYIYNSLEVRHLNNKLNAIACYKTQGFRPYSSPDYIKSLAVLRGGQVLKKYAESFELVRLIAE